MDPQFVAREINLSQSVAHNNSTIKKVKCTMPHGWSIGGCSSPSRWPWACRWINHWSLWRLASVIPSRPQSITALWPVINCTTWWQRHM